MTEISRTENGWPAHRGLVIFLLLLLPWSASPQALAQEEDGEYSVAEIAEERLELLHTIAEAHYEKAGLLSESGEPDAAISELRRILTLPFPKGDEIEEQLFRVNVTIVEIYLEADRFVEAEKLGRETLEKFPAGEPQALAELHILLGNALRGQDKNQAALEQLNRAIELGRAALEDLE